MRVYLCCALVALLSLPALAANPGFLGTYAKVAKEMVPELQQSKCEAKSVKNAPGKTSEECQLLAAHSTLIVDSVDKQTRGAWLRVNPFDLSHPADVTRAGGMLLRAARGGGYGDHLKVAMDVFVASQKIGGKKACKDDAASGMQMCVSNDAQGVYDITLDRK